MFYFNRKQLNVDSVMTSWQFHVFSIDWHLPAGCSRFRDDGVPVLRQFPGEVQHSVPDAAVAVQHAARQVLLPGTHPGGPQLGRHLLHELLQLHDAYHHEHIRCYTRLFSRWRKRRYVIVEFIVLFEANFACYALLGARHRYWWLLDEAHQKSLFFIYLFPFVINF